MANIAAVPLRSINFNNNLQILIYEHACHEGNSSMTFMLEGARAAESFATKNATTAEED